MSNFPNNKFQQKYTNWIQKIFKAFSEKITLTSCTASRRWRWEARRRRGRRSRGALRGWTPPRPPTSGGWSPTATTRTTTPWKWDMRLSAFVKEWHWILLQGMEDTVWRVGCYNINPTTPNGQKFFILHMLVLPLIPITALVIQNSVTMNTLLGYQSRVSTIRRQVSVHTYHSISGCHKSISALGPWRHGDRAVHPEPAGGEGRGRPVHLHQAVRRCELQSDGPED